MVRQTLQLRFDNGIVYDEEVEGAEISFKDAANEEDFYGSWSAESGHSLYLYGNVDLTIEEGGKWHGNIVDEDTEGTWTFDGKSMKLTSELFEVTLTFAEDGKLIMQEDREGNGNSMQLDLYGLANGHYTMRIVTTDGRVANRKFIVSK